MDALWREFLRNTSPLRRRAIVCIIDNDLTAVVEKIVYQLLAALEALLPELLGLRALLAWIASARTSPNGGSVRRERYAPSVK
jgi:hypothetical protein